MVSKKLRSQNVGLGAGNQRDTETTANFYLKFCVLCVLCDLCGSEF